MPRGQLSGGPNRPIGRCRSRLGALAGPYAVHKGVECLLLLLPATHRLSIDAERQRRVRAPHFRNQRGGVSPSA